MALSPGVTTDPSNKRPPGRRRGRLIAALLVIPVAAGVTWLVVERDGRAQPGAGTPVWQPLSSAELKDTDDALRRRSLAELAVFTDWLERNHAEGYIGEVGIPGGKDLDRWMALAQEWFTAADHAGLWVDAWSVGEWWGQDYTYCPFVSPADGGSLSITREQGKLLMWAAQNTDLPRGVDLSGGEFGAVGGSDEESKFSNENPGTYDEDWHYDSQESLDYLASRGMDTIRLPFRWERIQPDPGGPLDAAELGRLQAVVQRADSAGLKVILDVHNFGAYMLSDGDQGVRRAIGSAELPTAQFADLWRRLSEAFDGVPGVLAYDLMNEPVYLAGDDDPAGARIWEAASQEAVDAIRARGDDTLIMVPGYSYSRAADWVEMHPRAWITDPVGNFRYTAHHYWSPDQGQSYDDDLAEAVDDGY